MTNTRIITSGNRKGGVAKTNVCLNMGCYCANHVKNSKVLIFDSDEQGSISVSLGLQPNKFKYTVMDVILGECSIEEAIIKTKFGFDILPSNKKLAD
jgi:chromosome partitioning protein